MSLNPPVRRTTLTVATGAVWVALLMVGSFFLASYANSPGHASAPPPHWPASSHLKLDFREPSLVIFIHPHSATTRASIGELGVLMSQCQGRVKATAIFLDPSDFKGDWAFPDYLHQAGRIPGVTVVLDNDGHEARVFGSHQSGDALLYSIGGDLQFHGGLTLARNQSGDNTGRSALRALLWGEKSSPTNTLAINRASL